METPIGLPTVAIVGRPNVGKSALFNRLAGRRLAIVEDIPGLTRDRLQASVEWRNRRFMVVDTGGFVSDASEPVRVQVRAQADRAIGAADLILLVVDAAAGRHPEDEALAQHLREGQRPVLVVANKSDVPDHPGWYDFYALGLGDPLPISAIHGLGINDLLDTVADLLPEVPPASEERPSIAVAVVGRPNVGKSSLVNAVLGDDRVIVDPVPGTTRDAVDTPLVHNRQRLVLIDTAGLRRKARVAVPVERYSVNRALQAIDRSDVAVLVLEAAAPVANQDQEIARYTVEEGRALVLAVNKWDLVGPTPQATPAQLAPVRQAMRFVSYAPVVVTSATRYWGIGELLQRVAHAAASHGRRIPTGRLNRAIEAAEAAHAPPADRAGRQLKIYHATQPVTKPPTIVLFVNDPALLTNEYRRYLEGRLRDTVDFTGTPIRFVARPRQRGRGWVDR